MIAPVQQTSITDLAIELIRTDGGTQPRITQDWEVIAGYAQDMLLGAVFPPVIIYFDGDEYWLADGFHRYHATKQNASETISAEIRQGTRRDAVLCSVGVNAQHGLRRTNADKRSVIQKILSDAEWSQWSDYKIATICNVDHKTVSAVRKELELSREIPRYADRYVERNGTKYTMNATNIGHSQHQDYADIFDPVRQSIPSAFLHDEPFPPSWNHVNGQPFTAPLPDGKEIEIPEDWKLPPSLRNVDNIPVSVPHISSKNNEWYTPAKYIEAARLLMGEIDIDPASCDVANYTVQAAQYFTQLENGLNKDWPGRIWCNPPYGYTNGESNQSIWSGHLIDQYKNKITTEAVLLVNAAVDTKWFQQLFDYPVCLTLGRINFTTPDPVANGSTHGSAFIYFGPQPERFFEIFSEFGTVVKRW